MSKRSVLLAITAIATLSLAALAPTGASAKFGGGGGASHAGGSSGSHGMHGMHGGRGGGGGAGNHGGRGGGGGMHMGHGRGGHTFHPRKPIRIVRWHHKRWRPQILVRPGYVETYASVRPVTSYAVARPATCTCLTKEYLEDGSVLFKDVCTKEMAQNPPSAEQVQAAQAPAQ